MPGPDDCKPAGAATAAAGRSAIVGDVDVERPRRSSGRPSSTSGRASPARPTIRALDQALLAFATDGFLIGTAMRPHAGVGQAQAHRTVSTGVISHTLTFHEPCRRANGCCSRTAARTPVTGAATGRANVFRADGALVASFVQDGMIRPLASAAGGRTL